jgi:hypothetical protein
MTNTELIMTPLSALWLPIVLSAVLVFIVSSLLHMVLPWHKNDFVRLTNQDAVMDAVRGLNLAPGDYMVPHPTSREDLRSPEFAEKMRRGPRMTFTILPVGAFSMGRPLVLWFVYDLVVSLFAGYVASRANAPGTSYLQVFRFAGVTAFLAYSLALWQSVIWYGRSVSTTVKLTVDGLLFAFVTAGTFGWLWPR